MTSQRSHVGDHWRSWLAVRCPMLLIHGTDSVVVDTAHARDMVRKRPQTRYREFPGCGHWVHDDDTAGVADAVTAFVAEVEQTDP